MRNAIKNRRVCVGFVSISEVAKGKRRKSAERHKRQRPFSGDRATKHGESAVVRLSKPELLRLRAGCQAFGRKLGLQLGRSFQGKAADVAADHLAASQRNDWNKKQREPALLLKSRMHRRPGAFRAGPVQLPKRLGGAAETKEEEHWQPSNAPG